MTNIKHLRDLWVDNPEKKEFNRAFRIFRYNLLIFIVLTSSNHNLSPTYTIPE